MADEDTDEIEFTPEGAGAAFKAEMWAMNAMLGYWQYILATLVVVLVSVLFYGQWINQVQKTQRAAAAEIADAEGELPTPLLDLPRMIQDPAQEVDTEQLKATAAKLEAISSNYSGAGSIEASLKAAEIYRLAGDTEAQRRALQTGASNAKGPLLYAAEAAIANLDLEQDNGDAAVTRLRKLMDDNDGFLSEQAALDLGLALEHLERPGEASTVYSQFLEKWPDSPRADEVRGRQTRLSSGG